MFKAGDKVREISTGDTGRFVRYGSDEESADERYGDGRPMALVSWHIHSGAQLWIATDEIEAVEDAS